MKLYLSLMVATIVILGGCSAAAHGFDLDETVQIAEVFPQSKNQSAVYKPVSWKAIADWKKDDHNEALMAFVSSCEALRNDLRWKKVCAEARSIGELDSVGARLFFETHFQPYEMIGDGERSIGLVTGYYLPLLNGSRTKTARFAYPVYRKPKELVQIDLKAFSIDHKSIRGRLQSNGKIVPYYDRATIETDASLLKGNELFYVDDPIGLFFMHIQGSGLIKTPDGKIHQLGYSAQNGYPYYAIGKYLIEGKMIAKEDMSMQSIRKWLETHPSRMNEVMRKNRSYIFFEEANATLGVYGTQGTPLSAKRSIAVDREFIPLGSPVFISAEALKRLTIAQDTGGAIKGAVRADFFWGQGNEAAQSAGKMQENGRLFILLPKEEKKR
ncbi:membrane-bound lytic murein transglycosylase A [Campylobacterota bacterium]|nr:membrane-bound lytic murein transglycosylase A [Campylobacterota bacterium]